VRWEGGVGGLGEGMSLGREEMGGGGVFGCG